MAGPKERRLFPLLVLLSSAAEAAQPLAELPAATLALVRAMHRFQRGRKIIFLIVCRNDKRDHAASDSGSGSTALYNRAWAFCYTIADDVTRYPLPHRRRIGLGGSHPVHDVVA
jgi:hypothetical protein